MIERFFEDARDPDCPAADAVSKNGHAAGASILLIDDNPAVAGAMAIAFRLAGHRFDTAADPEEALSRLARARYDAILLDMNFSAGRADGEEGLACLRRIVADDPAACIVVITAHSGIRIAVAAMQAGARDFAMKPWRNAELVAKVEAAIARGAPAPAARAGGPADAAPPLLLGESAAMHALRALIRRIAPTAASVAISGPPGSGRNLAAQALHAASQDAGGRLLRIDLRDEAAWLRLAGAAGTIVLRHADTLDGIAQERLLDLLPPAARCIAIVDHAAAMGPALRRRIATVEVAIPPLAAREGDAVLLARHFLRAATERFGRGPARLSEAAETLVRTTRWPDEVRGLALAIERAALLTEGDVIDAAALTPPAAAPVATPAAEASFDLTDAERAMIEAALREHRHNVTHAATALGLSRGALYRRMARYGL